MVICLKRNTAPEGTGAAFPIRSITLCIDGLLEEGLTPQGVNTCTGVRLPFQVHIKYSNYLLANYEYFVKVKIKVTFYTKTNKNVENWKKT